MAGPASARPAPPAGQPFRSVLDRWARACASRGESPAATDTDRSRSHGELLRVARARARALIGGGLPADGRVVIALTSPIEQATWIAAVMLAGGCAVPLGRNLPDQRVRDLIRLARPHAVVADQATARLADGNAIVDGAGPGSAARARLPRPGPDSSAYLCFTSGTTGVPKGVVVTHRALAHTTALMASHLGLARRPRVHVLAASWSFDVAMMDLWLALTSGGTLLMPPRGNLLGAALPVTLAGLEAPVVHTPPSLFAGSSPADLRRLPAGTTVIVGGEPASAALLDELSRGTELHVVYGITETAIITTASPAPPGTTPDVIGRPLPGTDCVVVGETGRPVPDGEAGELFIGGPVVARGYLGDPAATAARFVAAEGGARRYRSGDLVRRRPDGLLTFHGRADQQVKIRGHRVEPAEVEQALLALPGVRQAAVLARRDPSGDLALAGYVAGDGLDLPAVRQAARARLPDWMCPSSMQVLPALPTGVTGKVDRGALPPPRWPSREPEAGRGPGTRAGGAEAGQPGGTQHAIGEMWQQLLGGSQPGGDANFIERGGHSLMAAQLTTALRDQLGVLVSVPDVLELPNLRALARHVDRLRDDARPAPPATTAPQARPATTAPLTTAPLTTTAPPGQEAPRRVHGAARQVWLHQELVGTAGVYNLVATVRLSGPLQVTTLQRALHLIERRHAALRTSLRFDGDELVAVEQSPRSRPLPIRNALVPDAVCDAVREAGAIALDPAVQPWSYQLIAAGPGEAVLLLTFHHAAIDGVALPWLLRELGDAYSALACPSRYPAPAPGPVAVPEVTDRLDAGWWSALLAGAPPPAALPGQQAAGDTAEFAGWCPPATLPGVAAGPLQRVAAAHGVTLHSGLLSVFLRTIAARTGTTDLTVGVTVSRRGREVGVRDIGQFVSVLPVRFVLPADLSATGCLAAASAAMQEVLRHCDVDPAAVMSAARAARGYPRGNVFRVAFSWEDEPPGIEFHGLDAAWALEFNGWSDSELSFERRRGDHVAGRVTGQATSAAVDTGAFLAAMGANAAELAAGLADGGRQ